MVWAHLLHSKGRSFRCSPGQGNTCCALWCCMSGGVPEGTVPLALHSAGFQSLPSLPISKLGPSGADPWVGGLVYVLGPCGSFQQTLLRGWEFLLLPQTPQMFSVRGFEALFPCMGALGWTVFLAPLLFLLVYLHANMGPPSPQSSASQGPPAYMAFIMLRCDPYIPTYLTVFIINGCWILSVAFLCIYWFDSMIFIFHFVYVMDHVYLFTDSVPTFYHENKSHLIMVYDLLVFLMTCWI